MEGIRKLSMRSRKEERATRSSRGVTSVRKTKEEQQPGDGVYLSV